jgi:acyl-CoA synthetase (AMP-forming)/AMP-acid ligase II
MAKDSTTHGPPLSEEHLGALTLGGYLREVCERFGPREAVVFYPPDAPVVRQSYSQVWQDAFTVARALVARGIVKETRVGLMCTNRPEFLSGIFGIALAGGTAVVMSTFATPAELDYQLRVGDVSLLIFERKILARDIAMELLQICPDIGSASGELRSLKLPYLRRLVCIGEQPANASLIEPWRQFCRPEGLADAALTEAMSEQVAPTDNGLVFFSSGTTARPKAILHMHRAAAIQCWRWASIWGVDENLRAWTANGYFWVGNFAMVVGATITAGGCLVLQQYYDAGEALRLMEKERVNFAFAWPHQWSRLTDDPYYAKADLSSLYYVPEESPLRRHPTVKSDWDEPVCAYGNTETLSINTIFPSGSPESIAGNNHGKPMGGNTIRIVDPLTDEVLGIDETGEIAVKGPTLMVGYLRVPPEEVFDEQGFFHTGDGGYIDERGWLHWHGRLNDIIKTGGANVSPQEIDVAIGKCPGVKIVATVGVPHDTLGELVVSCIVREPGSSLDEAAVRAFAAKSLSSYKVPRRVLFINEGEIELSGSNKVKTAVLRELVVKRLAAA